jgi:hypothetical protein
MASLSSYDDSATEAIDLGARLKVIEDQVRGELEARDLLYRLVAYKYLNASGLRVATVEAEIRRELRRSGAN